MSHDHHHDHSIMNPDTDMSEDTSDTCSMSMLFNWDTKNVCIIFEWWKVNSAGMMVLAFFILMLLAIAYEELRYALRRYDAAIIRNQYEHSQLEAGGAGSLFGAKSSVPIQFSWKHQLVCSILYALQVALGFISMLVFMTYNGILMIAVVVGAGIGFLLLFPL
jgi:copper transporter 1